MYVHSENLKLFATNENDEELKRLITDYSDISPLSEVRLYPEEMPNKQIFRIEEENMLIGEISLRTIKWYNRKAQVSIFIAQSFQGQGYGKKALHTLIQYAFNTINLERLEAEIVAFNPYSEKLFISCGFQKEGCLRKAKYFDGSYYDILCYGLLREEYKPPEKAAHPHFTPSGETIR